MSSVQLLCALDCRRGRERLTVVRIQTVSPDSLSSVNAISHHHQDPTITVYTVSGHSSCVTLTLPRHIFKRSTEATLAFRSLSDHLKGRVICKALARRVVCRTFPARDSRHLFE